MNPIKVQHITRRIAVRAALWAAGIALGLTFTGVSAQPGGQASAQPQRQTLRFVTGPWRATEEATRREWGPLAAYLAAETGNDVELIITPDWPSVGRALARKEADFAWMGGAWRYALARAEGGGPAIATVKFAGSATYRAVVIGRPGVAARAWPGEARGLSMSFTHDLSTTGWLVPYAHLKSIGIEPTTYFRYSDGAQHAENVEKVARGEVDLATDHENNLNAMIARGAVAKDAVAVLWRSELVPQDPVAVREGLGQDVVARLRAALTGITDDKAKSIPMPPGYSGFVPATAQSYQGIVDAGLLTGRLRQ